MNPPRSAARTALSVLGVLMACGDNLIADPSFELWCGDSLCAPWEVDGRVYPVKTWHQSDHGVALEDGAVISQRSLHDPVECIEFDVIADVEASAGVWLEVDFEDDGSSEFAQLIPESHWARLRYRIQSPTWYDRARFILRKTGAGRAVLAQIRATAGSDCAGEPLPLVDRPNGAVCTSEADCKSGVCGAAPAESAAGFARDLIGEALRSCGDCSELAPCPDGQVCGAERSPAGLFTTCIPVASQALSAFCLSDAECQSGHCAAPTALAHQSCGSCASDGDCAPDEVCNARGNPLGAARACELQGSRGLGELCSAGEACASGVCCDGACSECCEDQPCDGGLECGSAEPAALSIEPRLCDPGQHRRAAGEPCTSALDCATGQCDEPDPGCQLCEGDGCDLADAHTCGLLRRLAGVCR